jgi:VWFA-related protein
MWSHLKLAAPLVCVSCLLLAAPQQRKTVSVLVSVTDKQGAPVPNLKEADFTIREEGKPQTIRSLVRADASPLSIVLLIDKSGSTHDSGREVTKAVDASLQFFRAVLQPGRDKVALVTFNSVVAKDQDFSEDLPRLFQVLVGTLTRPSWGGTALHDAIFGASTLLEGRPGRRFILLVGDGVDNASRLSLPEVIKIIHTADIEIITIWMPSPGPPGANLFRQWSVPGPRISEGDRRRNRWPILRKYRDQGARQVQPGSGCPILDGISVHESQA